MATAQVKVEATAQGDGQIQAAMTAARAKTISRWGRGKGERATLNLRFPGVGLLRRRGKGRYVLLVIPSLDSPIFQDLTRAEQDLVRGASMEGTAFEGQCVMSMQLAIKYGSPITAGDCVPVSCMGTCYKYSTSGGSSAASGCGCSTPSSVVTGNGRIDRLPERTNGDIIDRPRRRRK